MIRTSSLGKYLRVVKARGIAPSRLLAGTGISRSALSNPDHFVDLEQHDALVLNLMRVTNRPDITFVVGDQFDVADMGVVGYALLSARTVRSAISIWLQYSQSFIGSTLHVSVAEQAQERWSLHIRPMTENADIQRFYIEELLIISCKLFQILAGRSLTVTKLELAYPPPRHVTTYEKWFKCPTVFNARETVLSFSAEPLGLDTPVRSNNPELHQLISQYCQTILRATPRTGTLQPRLRSLFLTNSGALPDQGNAAQHLGFSYRTLHRRLSRDGTTYRRLKEDFRRELSLQYLETTTLSLKEISYLLGYSNTSAFGRAFKSWMRVSPAHHRSAGAARSDRSRS